MKTRAHPFRMAIFWAVTLNAVLLSLPGLPGLAAKAEASGKSPSTPITSNASFPALLGLGSDGAQGIETGISKDYLNWSLVKSTITLPGAGQVRDINICRNSDGTPYKYKGRYFAAFTTGNFGTCGYFAIASSLNLRAWTLVKDVPITGPSVQVLSTTVSTMEGSSAINLGSTEGLVSGQVYYLTGVSGLPAEAAFLYDAAGGRSQTLGYQSNKGALVGGQTLAATATRSDAACRVNFANNVWGPNWFIDRDGTMGIELRLSTQAGGSFGPPGLGYVTCLDPGTFQIWSDYDGLTINVGSSGFRSTTGLATGGPFYYPANATYYLVFNNVFYATASSARGPYTIQPTPLSIPTSPGFEHVSLINLGDPRHWIALLQLGAEGDHAGFSETVTGLSGTWSTPVAQNTADIYGCIGLQAALLTKPEDFAVALGAFLIPTHNLVFANSETGGTQSSVVVTQTDLENYQFRVGAASLLGSGPQTRRGTLALLLDERGATTPQLQITGSSFAGTTGLYLGGPANGIGTNGSGYWRFSPTSDFQVEDVANGYEVFDISRAASGSSVATMTGSLLTTTGNIEADTEGYGLQVKEGTNAKQGTATLVAGTVTVNNTSVTANSRIQLSGGALNSSTALGILSVPTIVAGTSFVITSYVPGEVTPQTGDLRTVNYEIFEPAR